MLKPKSGTDEQKWIINDVMDLMSAAAASRADIIEFDHVRNDQEGVAVLDKNPKPFYVFTPSHHVYKYKKIIDQSKVPGEVWHKVQDKLGRLGAAIAPVIVMLDLGQDFVGGLIHLFGGGQDNTKRAVDSWTPCYPDRITVCGRMLEDASVCSQDYGHTQVTVDKDLNFNIFPNDRSHTYLDTWTIPFCISDMIILKTR